MFLTVSGQIVDVVQKKIFPGTITYENNKITKVVPENSAPNVWILPGLIDAHVHIESSMMVPSEFARLAVIQGTVGTVSDPHEIGNVLGIDGVLYMIENGNTVPFHFYFGAPSCVPATQFETSGATIGPDQIRELLMRKEIHYLSEMMNFPGVIHKDPDVMKKIATAHQLGKPVDGHAPGLRGHDLETYIAAGITTDHETFTYEEGKEKILKGMKVIIREGTAAKNFAVLIPLLKEFPDDVMFCTDDLDEGLTEGHINRFLAKAVAQGYDLMAAIRAATYNPVKHYQLETGLLQVGDPATFIVVEDLKNFRVLQTFIDGKKVAENGKCLFQTEKPRIVNHFNRSPIQQDQIAIKAKSEFIRVIEAIDGELITRDNEHTKAKIIDGNCVSDLERDILKLVVVNRYENAMPAIAFIKSFGLKRGAIAATVAHDSHNVIAVGVNDASLTLAINALIESKGGLVAVDGNEVTLLPLPIAGLMSDMDGYTLSKKFRAINEKVRALGSTLHAPFMTLSFMALLVIPALKLSDKGLFDGKLFKFTSLFI